jgi:predicted nucleic acid-binding protein
MKLWQAKRRSVYDSWYLSLAEETGCEFWTADEKLYNATQDRLTFVKWLGDYVTAAGDGTL